MPPSCCSVPGGCEAWTGPACPRRRVNEESCKPWDRWSSGCVPVGVRRSSWFSSVSTFCSGTRFWPGDGWEICQSELINNSILTSQNAIIQKYAYELSFRSFFKNSLRTLYALHVYCKHNANLNWSFLFKKLKHNETEHSMKLEKSNLFTCVCVSPNEAASSALSGSARYCVFWNLRCRAASWKLE